MVNKENVLSTLDISKLLIKLEISRLKIKIYIKFFYSHFNIAPVAAKQ